MALFEKQTDGSYLGVLTERAVAWAAGNLDNQAHIGFAGFALDQRLLPSWVPDDPSIIEFGGVSGATRIHRDLSTVYDEFSVETVTDEEGWDAIVRVLDGPLPIIHVLGLSGTLKQHSRSGEQTSRTRLCKVDEWLSQWPHHWKGAACPS